MDTLNRYELQVIGSGAGASSVYEGLTSSSFMLLEKGKPFCLVDLGLGVGNKTIEMFNGFPKNVIITHNHSDHAGDLPVVLRVELAQGNKMTVIAAEPVQQRLKLHRIAEHLQQMSADELANWLAVAELERVSIGHGLSIEFYPGIHSELSYGFALFDDNNRMRLSYTADSQFNQTFYQTLSQADVFIVDARPLQNSWHASFNEIEPWLKKNSYILGHGLSKKKAKTLYPQLPLLFAEQKIAF